MDSKAKAHFEVLVFAEYTVRAIRRLMEVEGHDLSGLDDDVLIRKMLKILENTKEDRSE